MVSGDCEWIIAPLLRIAQSGPPFYLIADEAVFNAEQVGRVLSFIEYVSEAVVELIVLIVIYGELAIVHTERVAEVIANGVSVYFYDPVVEIFAVEQLLPGRFRRFGAAGGST